jgi:hypothetical protein
VDPIKDGVNWYVYCGNNPLRYVDPDGLMSLDVNVEVKQKTSSKVKQAVSIVTAVAIAEPTCAGEVVVGLILGVLSLLGQNEYQLEMSSDSDYDNAHPAPGFHVTDQISRGHAQDKHLDEFYDLGIEDADDLADHINDIIDSEWTQHGELARGREYYYDPETNTLVIIDPSHVDGGTVYRPENEQDEVDNLE